MLGLKTIKSTSLLYVFFSLIYLINIWVIKEILYDSDIVYFLLIPLLIFPCFYLIYGIFLFFKKNEIILENNSSSEQTHDYKILYSNIIVLPLIALGMDILIYIIRPGGWGGITFMFLAIFLGLGYFILTIIVYLLKTKNKSPEQNNVGGFNNFFSKSQSIFKIFMIITIILIFFTINELPGSIKYNSDRQQKELAVEELSKYLNQMKINDDIEDLSSQIKIYNNKTGWDSKFIDYQNKFFVSCKGNLKTYSSAHDDFLIYLNNKLIYKKMRNSDMVSEIIFSDEIFILPEPPYTKNYVEICGKLILLEELNPNDDFIWNNSLFED